MIEFAPARCSEEAYSAYSQLFSESFPGIEKFTPDYIRWLYEQNPDGHVVGFDAWDGGRLVAHYACIPTKAEVAGQDARALLSLNTATHPAFQGRGLFTKLADLTYGAATQQGFDCVYGVANSNSTPGFLRKLGFQLVGPLTASMGLGSLGIRFLHSEPLSFRRCWSAEALAWRCTSPINPVGWRRGTDRTTYFAAALFQGACVAVAELSEEPPSGRAKGRLGPLRLFVGRVPSPWQARKLYFDIPDRLRPSPLNLIYRSLSGRAERLDPDHVFFSFLDFDAF